MSLPTRALPRARILPSKPICQHQQVRHATLLNRPLIPYSFTQLVRLSDGSTYLTRTTSPAPVYRSTKDTRNTVLWQPSMASLKNIEQDEAGRLRAFRQRFGRGWDLDAPEDESAESSSKDSKMETASLHEDSLMDLISGAAGIEVDSGNAGAAKEPEVKQKAGKKGSK